jgi:hypothetical protein
MKHITALSICIGIFLCSQNVVAQIVQDTVRFAQSIISMEKKKIVLEYMKLTEAEKAAFWPVYDSYSSATQYLEMQYHQMLVELAQDYKRLTPAEVEKFSKRILQNDFMIARVRKQYYRKFKRALTIERASEFMQLDNSIRMTIRYEVHANSVPRHLSHAFFSPKPYSF